jgi:hypothetical protein
LNAAAGQQQELRDFYRDAGGEVTVALVVIAAAKSKQYAKSRLRPAELARFLLCMGIFGFVVMCASIAFLHNDVVVTGGLALATAATVALIDERGPEE